MGQVLWRSGKGNAMWGELYTVIQGGSQQSSGLFIRYLGLGEISCDCCSRQAGLLLHSLALGKHWFFSSELNQENKAIQTESGEEWFKLLTMLLSGETEPGRNMVDVLAIFEYAMQEALDSFCLHRFGESYKEMTIGWLKRKLITNTIVMMISVCVTWGGGRTGVFILDHMWESEANSVDLALGLELRSPGLYSKCLYLLRCRTTGSLGREIMDGIRVPDSHAEWLLRIWKFLIMWPLGMVKLLPHKTFHSMAFAQERKECRNVVEKAAISKEGR